MAAEDVRQHLQAEQQNAAADAAASPPAGVAAAAGSPPLLAPPQQRQQQAARHQQQFWFSPKNASPAGMLELNALPSAIQFVTVKWITESLAAGRKYVAGSY